MKKSIKKRSYNYSFYDNNENLVFSGVCEEIPLKESIVINKSIEFFNDPTPCYIHRGAVMVRLYSEIEQIVNAEILTEIPQIISCYIDLNNILYYLKK